jgi:Protein of unknown function (DUF2934)
LGSKLPGTSRTRKTKCAAAETEMQPDETDQVAVRAYEIYESGQGGGPLEHWLRAERELAAGNN